MYRNSRIVVLAHRLLCFFFMVAFAVHLIDIHMYDLLRHPFSAFVMLTISTVYAVWGGVLQLGKDKKKLMQYLVGIFAVILMTFVVSVFNKDIVVVVALLGFLLGFYDFRLVIKNLN